MLQNNCLLRGLLLKLMRQQYGQMVSCITKLIAIILIQVRIYLFELFNELFLQPKSHLLLVASYRRINITIQFYCSYSIKGHKFKLIN